MRCLFVLLCFLLLTTQALATRTLDGHQVWTGKVSVDENLVVPAGPSLTIVPGTEISFASETVLTVEGRLTARGSAEQPVDCRCYLPIR